MQIQQKQKAASERENNQNINKVLEKAKRKLEKQNATLRTINLELETKLHSSNRHLNNKNSHNGHQTFIIKESQYIIERENSKENSAKAIEYMSLTYCQKESKNETC